MCPAHETDIGINLENAELLKAACSPSFFASAAFTTAPLLNAILFLIYVSDSTTEIVTSNTLVCFDPVVTANSQEILQGYLPTKSVPSDTYLVG